jgi:hypothetical protein
MQNQPTSGRGVPYRQEGARRIKNRRGEMRESKMVGWFFCVVGAGVFLFSVWTAVTLAAPPSTNSVVQIGIDKILITAFGTLGGNLLVHLIWATIGACVAWFGLRVLKDHKN